MSDNIRDVQLRVSAPLHIPWWARLLGFRPPRPGNELVMIAAQLNDINAHLREMKKKDG